MENNNIFDKKYVKEAEKCIRLLKEQKEDETENEKKIEYSRKEYNFKITTSQIRKLLSILNDIYSYVVSMSSATDDGNLNQLTSEDYILKDKMQYLKMRCIYESGRDEFRDKIKTTGVHDFLYRTKLIQYLDEFDKIQDHEKLHEAFIWIFHYMESLVAYHRFLGGKDSER